MPLTYMGELTVGTGSAGTRTAMYNEAFWILRNGLHARGKIDTGWEGGSMQTRYSLGLDVTPLPGITFTGLGRALRASGDSRLQPDVFVQAHIWF